jgi:hypothetical protein
MSASLDVEDTTPVGFVQNNPIAVQRSTQIVIPNP